LQKRPIVVLSLLLGIICLTVPGLAAQQTPAAPSPASKPNVPPAPGQPLPPPAASQPASPLELKGTRPSSEQEKTVFTQANDLYEKGDYDLAIFNLQEFISRYQESSDLPRAYFLLGESYLRTQAFQLAVPNLRKVVEEYQTMPFFQTAMEDLAQAYLELGDTDHALGLYQQLLDIAKDQGSRAILHDRIADLQIKKKDYVKAIESLLAERSLVQEAERSAITDRIGAVLDQGLKEKDLQEVVLLYPKTFPGDSAMIKLAQLYESKGDVYRTERELQRFLRAFPKHDQVSQAHSQLDAIKKKIQSHRVVIGVLLPLSGKLGVFGEEVVNGIQIAMDQMKDSLKEDQVGVAIVDSAEPSSTILSQLDLLNKEYSPIAVIGPLMSKEVVQLASRIERLQIPLISPSATAPGLSKESKYIFRNSITNEQQGRAMAEYAVTTLGLKRFVILHPNDQHGAGLSQVFKTQVTRLGGTILTVQAYPMDDTDFGPQLKQIKEIDLKETGTLVPVEGKDKSPPEYIPGFDAIFLPGDADKVGLIASQLAFYDFKKITLLGSNGWNSKDLIKMGGRFMEGGVFVDGFFAGSSDPAVQSFVERYRARYQAEPTIFAAQAYDIARIILTGLQRGITNGSSLRDYLWTVRDFAGASGRLNFTPEGEAEKKLFIIQIKNGRFVQVG
jgi:branched-chain amino acid transport system substrate-binding protein